MRKPDTTDSEEVAKGKVAKALLDAMSDETKQKVIESGLKDFSRSAATLHALGYKGHTMVATRAADGVKIKLRISIEEVE